MMIDFATMLEESFKQSNDTVCNGVVVAIKAHEIFLNIGKKSEGIFKF